MTVTGEAEDGLAALEVVRRDHPDVVLMDIRMPRMDGVEATRLIRELDDPPHVIRLTTFDADDLVVRALQAGAGGFLLRTPDPSGWLLPSRRSWTASRCSRPPSRADWSIR